MTDGKAPLARLLATIETDEPDADLLLDRFLDYAGSLGLTLYPAQEEAILAVLEGRHVVLGTPTGSGKSLVALAMHFKAMAERRLSFYTAPTKALVNEKFFALCDAFGPADVGMLTGDASVNREAPIICCTAEILANMALRDGACDVSYAVMDEFHFYGDKERGAAWQIPLVTLRDTQFLLMSATLGDTTEIERKVEGFTDRAVAAVSGRQRPVPLSFEYRETPLHETIEDLLTAGEAPIYLVSFTQRQVAEEAQNLVSAGIASREDRATIGRELAGSRFDTPYGKEFQRLTRAGVGVHHAGLLPRYRLLVEKLSQAGLLKVVSGTDSLGVGVNVPIRTVVFTKLCKYDGEKTQILSAREFHQIAGRAGRKGFDDHGRVVAQAPEHVIENKRIEMKLAKNPHLRNKLHKRKAPERNFVNWDKKTFERLEGSRPEPLTPRLEVGHGMIVNVMRAGGGGPDGGYRRLVEIVRSSHVHDGEKRRQLRRAASLVRSLRYVGVVELVPDPGRRGSRLRLHADLQEDFSLHHALSLYLVEAIERLDRAAETYALDAVTLVESIIEDPDIILRRQVDRLKDALVARMKAEGVEYEDRMRELEKVEHPKPLRDFVYDTFNAFAAIHPWVGTENIRPKSIAREMYEKCMGFNDFVIEYGLERSEGLLLRYLSQFVRTLVQNVPAPARDEALEDVIDYFYALVHMVDASLLEEWEARMEGRQRAPLRGGVEKKDASDLANDPRKLKARLRGEMLRLLGCLAKARFDEALEFLRPGEEAWTERRLSEAMAPFYEACGAIDLTPRGRRPEHTFVRETGRRTYEVVQRIVAKDGSDDWMLVAEVDLSRPFDEAEPLIALKHVGT
ncbi:MAG: DUF3516 domain-containing protein [Deltaproteobacteria bacterium]|nr:DUF3516 domain-containing protein [Deltaproteobacteria bacterium]